MLVGVSTDLERPAIGPPVEQHVIVVRVHRETRRRLSRNGRWSRWRTDPPQVLGGPAASLGQLTRGGRNGMGRRDEDEAE